MFDRTTLFAFVVIVCVINGIFSPPLLLFFLQGIKIFFGLWSPGPSVMFYLASLGASTVTLVVAGVPAALYERFSRLEESNGVSMIIWLVSALVLSIPALQTLIAIG